MTTLALTAKVFAGILVASALVWVAGICLDAVLHPRQRALFASLCFTAGFASCALLLALR